MVGGWGERGQDSQLTAHVRVSQQQLTKLSVGDPGKRFGADNRTWPVVVSTATESDIKASTAMESDIEASTAAKFYIEDSTAAV